MLRRHALWVAALAVLVFLPVLGLGFAYDDDWTITENKSFDRPVWDLIAVLASGESLAQRVPNATRPFTTLSFWFDHKLFGGFAPAYHAHSLLLYAACCGFATILTWQLTRRRSVALFAGVFFTVAPLHAEPVSAINYRSELYAGLAVFGGLACLLAPLRVGVRAKTRAARAKARLAEDGWGRAAFVAGVTFAGLTAKESGVAVVLLLACAWIAVPRVREVLKVRRRSLAAFAVAVGLWAFWRLPLLFRGDDLPLAPERGFWQRLLRFARFEVEAVKNALLPWNYNPEHWRQPDASVGSLVTFAVIVFATVVLWRVRATRIPALGIAFALVAPLPSSPLVRPINEFADRYFFVAVLGGGIFWGWCVLRLGLGLRGGLDRAFRWLRRRPFGLGVLCLPLLVPTFRATQIWKDNRTLWTAAVAITPHSPRAWLNLSRVQRKANEVAEANRSLEHAIGLVPNYAPALLARVYDDITDGRMQDARAHVEQILAAGLANARGVRRAVECVKLEAADAKRCADR